MHACHAQCSLTSMRALTPCTLTRHARDTRLTLARQVVQQALRAGKHVLQEKPVAGTVALALEAIRTYRSSVASAAAAASPSHPPAHPLWGVAENYRFEGVFLEACQARMLRPERAARDVPGVLPPSARACDGSSRPHIIRA